MTSSGVAAVYVLSVDLSIVSLLVVSCEEGGRASQDEGARGGPSEKR